VYRDGEQQLCQNRVGICHENPRTNLNGGIDKEEEEAYVGD
jgi:hypothetical protein